MSQIKATYIPSKSILTHSSSLALKIIENAKVSASELVRGRRKKWSEYLRVCRAKGFKRGFEAGLLAARLELAKRSDELTKNFQEKIKNSEKECVKIALCVSERVIKESFESSRDLISSRVRELLDKLITNDQTRLLVNHQDASFLEKLSLYSNVQLTISPHIDRGDFEIETSAGSVSMSWREALREIKENIIGNIR